MEDSEPLNEKGTRSELRTLERALTDPAWDIPEQAMAYLPRRLLKIISNSKHERNVIAATRVLATLVKDNKPPEASLHLHQHAKAGSDTPPQVKAMTFDEKREHIQGRIDRLTRLGHIG